MSVFTHESNYLVLKQVSNPISWAFIHVLLQNIRLGRNYLGRYVELGLQV